MLQLPPPDHRGQHPLHRLLGVLLLSKVLHDGVVGHLASDGEPFLELTLYLEQELLILLSGESLGSREIPRLGSGEG